MQWAMFIFTYPFIAKRSKLIYFLKIDFVHLLSVEIGIDSDTMRVSVSSDSINQYM